MNAVEPDWLDLHGRSLPVAAIRSARAQVLSEAAAGPAGSSARRLAAVVDGMPALSPSRLILDEPVVRIGRSEDLTVAERQHLLAGLREFMPWKKGPFDFFGIEIDAEWRSDLKWGRLEPFIMPLAGKRVADIGCHNGYFMFRMAAQNPEIVVGFEPVMRHSQAFSMIQRYSARPELRFELLGVEHMPLFPGFFDVIFCLGILYHHTDPVGLLRGLRSALRPDGQMLIDCQGIAGDGSRALMPSGRYAGASGIWWLPTADCLLQWLRRAGWRSCRLFYDEALSPQEQRTTAWAPIKSLNDFLDPSDPGRTVEGYPAPRRFYVEARP